MSPLDLQESDLVIKLRKQTNKSKNISILLKVLFIQATGIRLELDNDKLTFITLHHAGYTRPTTTTKNNVTPNM